MQTKLKKGKVYLVGAGPGDPKLITVRGLECVRRADVLVYDYLASEKLVGEARPGCEKIYVGKRAGQHTLRQDEISALLVAKAREGKVVVRLKGGDPFVFGRGGEEALGLAKNGVEFEIVPGVTAATAAPAYAGIPVTHRGLASSVALITGHEDPTKARSDVDWSRISTGAGTLVFFMGLRNLRTIAERLRENGRPLDTPVALIERGTKPEQRTLVGTLGDIVERAETEDLQPPALIVVGKVVELREKLNWFETKPLFGKKILVTRSRMQAGHLSRRLEELGALALEFPTIKIEDPDDWEPLDRAIRIVETFDWIVFTSANGVDKFFGRAFHLGKDIRDLKGPRICVIGSATADRVEAYHLKVDLKPEKYVAESVVEAFRDLGDLSGSRILLPRADIARDLLPDELKKMGADVTEVVAYCTVPGDPPDETLLNMFERGEIDLVTFTSSSTVRNFAAILGERKAVELLNRTEVASIGPITSAAVRELGIEVDVQAEEYTIPGLVDAIIRYYSKNPNIRPI